jgi:FkbM family methyltransferase
MKLQELQSLHKLPAQYRKRVLAYSWRKMLGLARTEQQTEAHRLLRFLASANSGVIETDSSPIRLQVGVLGKTLQIEARSYPSSDLGILYQVLGKVEYSPVVELAKKLKLQPPFRIVDAGDNVGYATLYFKSAFPEAVIVSLEIDSSNVQQLEAHVASNQLADVHIWQKALWSRGANLRIRRDFRDQSECSFYVEETLEAPEVIGCSLRAICQHMQWNAIDILKIDIEGGERYLFETDALADELLSATRILALEIHEEFQIRPDVLRHFQRNGFTYFDHGDLTIAYKNKG